MSLEKAATPLKEAAQASTPYRAPSESFGPPVEASKVSGKPVFAHYMPTLPMSLNNAVGAKDYYTSVYTKPVQEPIGAGKYVDHRPYGGLMRDRPLAAKEGSFAKVDAAKLGADAPESYLVANAKLEIEQARSAGVDGFAVDLLDLNTGSVQYQRTLAMFVAAEQSGFRILLQPDMYALGVGQAGISDSSFVDKLSYLAKTFPSAVYQDSAGRVVISPFMAETKTPAWWKTTLAAINAKGVKTAFLPLFLNANTYSGDWVTMSIGFSEWGGRSPGKVSSRASTAKALGRLWMQPVAAQDARPREAGTASGSYFEAGNSETLRTSWRLAIGTSTSPAADIVLLTTWNDYTETTSFAPSVQHGYSLLDLSSPYVAAFKSGSYPKTFARETAFISHRSQLSTAVGSAQALIMSLRGGGQSAPVRDEVELLTMLNAPATVKVSVGSQSYSYEAPSGICAARLPLVAGTFVSAKVVRGSSVVGTVAAQDTGNPDETVHANPAVQDMGYWFASSGRVLPVRP